MQGVGVRGFPVLWERLTVDEGLVDFIGDLQLFKYSVSRGKIS